MADLRDALTADNADRRAEAYGSVMAEDVQPSEMLETPPNPNSLQALRRANIVPDEDRDRGNPMRDVNERIVELLEDILDELQGDVVAQDGGSQ